MKQQFIAQQDCVITGVERPVRYGDRVALTARAAKYPLIRGWIAPAPAEAGATSAVRAATAPPKRARRAGGKK